MAQKRRSTHNSESASTASVASSSFVAVQDFSWNSTLSGLTLIDPEMIGDSMPFHLKNVAVPVHAFYDAPFGEHTQTLDTNVVVEIEYMVHPDELPDGGAVTLLWVARILKMAGYYALMRWYGMENESDPSKGDFLINITSTRLHPVGYTRDGSMFLVPPEVIEKRGTNWVSYLNVKLSQEKPRTFNKKAFADIRNGANISKYRVGPCTNMKVGDRFELLSNLYSTYVRPARVIEVVGKRLRVQVLPVDAYKHEEENCEDRQYGSEFWVDEKSFFVFHVGWATLNGYGLKARKHYVEHCLRIATAIKEGVEPPFEEFDVRPEVVAKGRLHVSHKGQPPTSEWAVGMKLECADPLSQSFRDLKVATVLDVLKDGYLRIGFDGPDAEEECVPLHKDWPLLFPVGYSKKYAIPLTPPVGKEENFDWTAYLEETGAVAAPEDLFYDTFEEEVKDEFRVYAKLEASDMCEQALICPATVVDVRGRLVLIHFDGWSEDFDQFYEFTSSDIYPIGWCEAHNYPLQFPKKGAPKKMVKITEMRTPH